MGAQEADEVERARIWKRITSDENWQRSRHEPGANPSAWTRRDEAGRRRRFSAEQGGAQSAMTDGKRQKRQFRTTLDYALRQRNSEGDLTMVRKSAGVASAIPGTKTRWGLLFPLRISNNASSLLSKFSRGWLLPTCQAYHPCASPPRSRIGRASPNNTIEGTAIILEVDQAVVHPPNSTALAGWYHETAREVCACRTR